MIRNSLAQCMTRSTVIALTLVAIVWALLASVQPAQAAGVVGSGTPQSCTESAFVAALLGGGLVTFNCGAGPTTISITLGHKVISQSTSIDGNGLITLYAYNSNIFLVTTGQALTLTGITLSNDISNGNGGCVYVDGGSLLLMNGTVSGCRASNPYGGSPPFDNGGGIYSNNGVVTIISSTLTGNVALDGGAIESYGMASLIISNSVVSGNHAFEVAGSIYNYGAVTLTNSTINDNSAQGGPGGKFGEAGGITNYGTLTLNNSDVSGNFAIAGGGGIINYGASTLNNSTVNRNGAGLGTGGGIKNFGTLTLNNSTLNGNSGGLGGSGGIVNVGTATLNNSSLSGNGTTNGDGGGILNTGTITLINSTLSGNVTIYGDGGGIVNVGTATLTNSTLSGNSANRNGGGISNTNILTLTNVTLSGNSANAGGGLSHLTGTISLKNTIIANSPNGGNCLGSIIPARYSISSDATCSLMGTGDLTRTDPLLYPLGNYGGPTQVHLPMPGSRAIDGVLDNDGPAVDQRGVSRPQGVALDIGAVERRSIDIAPRQYLPLAER